MIIVLKTDISKEQRQALEEFLQRKGLQVHEIVGSKQSVLGAIGSPSIGPEELASLSGVQEVIPISKPYKRASREFQKTDSVYHLSGGLGTKDVGTKPKPKQGAGIYIGGQRLVLSVELWLSAGASNEPAEWAADSAQWDKWAEALQPLKDAGISILSHTPKMLDSRYVYDSKGFKDTQRRELAWVQQIQQRSALPLLCTVPGLSMLEELGGLADILQVEGFQMRNMELLAELARCGKPLILQRAADATLEELLLAAEFLLNNGLRELVLAENYMPNPASSQNLMLDFANIQLLQELSHLPVFVNLKPRANSASANYQQAGGHASRRQAEERRFSQLSSMALAALAAGAQGIEFAVNPQDLLRDFSGGFAPGLRPQHLLAEPQEASYMLEQLSEMAILLQRELVRLPKKIDKQADKQTDKLDSSLAADAERVALKVAFQGEPGAYSEQALRQFFRSEQAKAVVPQALRFSSTESVACPSFRRMFEAVQKAELHFAVVPLENSLAGSIMENYDLLLEYPDLCICAETRLRVSHMLIGSKQQAAAKESTTEGSKEGARDKWARLKDLQIVRSHPQALAQSSRFLEKHGLRPMANFDTAGSVRELKEQPEPHTAAIASALAAEIYDMEILAEAIESNPHNYTRFAIVTRRDSELLALQSKGGQTEAIQAQGDKWSLCLRLRNFSGSLAAALQIFEKYHLDLTKLESRPIMGQPWSYRFYLDALIDKGLDAAREAEFFAELQKISEEYHVIGRYWKNLH